MMVTEQISEVDDQQLNHLDHLDYQRKKKRLISISI
jgi:hypothetical protein